MKIFKRVFALVLSLCLTLGCFSLTANAAVTLAFENPVETFNWNDSGIYTTLMTTGLTVSNVAVESSNTAIVDVNRVVSVGMNVFWVYLNLNGLGTATLTARSTDGNNLVTTTEITVQKKVQYINVNLTVENICIDDVLSLDGKVSFSPSDATDISLSYESLTPDILTVDENGVITAIAEGNGRIKIYANEDKTVYTDCSIKVIPYIEEIVVNNTVCVPVLDNDCFLLNRFIEYVEPGGNEDNPECIDVISYTGELETNDVFEIGKTYNVVLRNETIPFIAIPAANANPAYLYGETFDENTTCLEFNNGEDFLIYIGFVGGKLSFIANMDSNIYVYMDIFDENNNPVILTNVFIGDSTANLYTFRSNTNYASDYFDEFSNIFVASEPSVYTENKDLYEATLIPANEADPTYMYGYTFDENSKCLAFEELETEDYCGPAYIGIMDGKIVMPMTNYDETLCMTVFEKLVADTIEEPETSVKPENWLRDIVFEYDLETQIYKSNDSLTYDDVSIGDVFYLKASTSDGIMTGTVISPENIDSERMSGFAFDEGTVCVAVEVPVEDTTLIFYMGTINDVLYFVHSSDVPETTVLTFSLLSSPEYVTPEVATPNEIIIPLGSFAILEISIVPDTVPFYRSTINVSTDDTSIACVRTDSEAGSVIGGGVGETLLRFIANDNSGVVKEVPVTVYNPGAQVTSVIIETAATEIEKNSSLDLTVSVQPDDVADKSVTWTSSDDNVATVDENGILTAHNIGNVTITATSVANPEISDSVAYSVIETVYGELTAIADNYELYVGDTTQASWTLPIYTYRANEESPAITYLEDVPFVYASSNPDCIAIDENGIITALAAGTTTITVSVNNGEVITATFEVEANDRYFDVNTDITDEHLAATANDVSDILSSFNINLAADDWYLLPETVIVHVGNEIIDSSLYQYNRETGTIVIDSGVVNNDVTIEATAIAIDRPVTGIEITTAKTNYGVGETVIMSATVYPEYALNKNVEWSSSDENIATIDANGVVTVLRGGEVTITAASAENPAIFDTLTIRVSATTTKHNVIFTKPDYADFIINGYTYYDYAVIACEKGTSLTFRVQWYSSNPCQNYIVTANGEAITPNADGSYTLTDIQQEKLIIVTGTIMDSVEETKNLWSVIAELFAKIIDFFKNLFR